MQEAFKEDRDIHANTAMKIFGLDSADQVTPDMRRQAKATNFGIVYGISDFGLAANIGITRSQAKAFIAGYFEQYPDVKTYMDKMVAKRARMATSRRCLTGAGTCAIFTAVTSTCAALQSGPR